MSEDKQVLGTDFASYIEAKKKNAFLSLETEAQSLDPIRFVKNLFGWMMWRTLRIVGSIVGLIISLEQMVITLKTDMLQVFYWGRSNTFGIFLQSIFVFILVTIGFTFLLGGGINSNIEQVSASDTIVETLGASSATNGQDVMVETGSLETLTPHEVSRFDIESYIVRPGDTLDSIIKDHYPDLNVDSLRWANNLKPGDGIKIGQELKIPPGPGVMYVVRPGDTLDLIAAKHNASQQAIAEANWFDSASDLRVGEEILIPNGTLPQPTKVPRPFVPPKGPQPVAEGSRFLSWPVAPSPTTHVSQCPNPFHMALDIADASSPMLVAAAPGEVTYAGYHPSGYAWVVEIDHGNGYSTLYGHMVQNSIIVHVGEHVVRGQPIGRMGETGLAFGIHVHFEVSQGGALKKSKRHLVPPPAFMIGSYCGY